MGSSVGCPVSAGPAWAILLGYLWIGPFSRGLNLFIYYFGVRNDSNKSGLMHENRIEDVKLIFEKFYNNLLLIETYAWTSLVIHDKQNTNIWFQEFLDLF